MEKNDGTQGDVVQARAVPDDLSTCAGCYLAEDLGGPTRVRISSPDPSVHAGVLHLESTVPRTVRWDLYLDE